MIMTGLPKRAINKNSTGSTFGHDFTDSRERTSNWQISGSYSATVTTIASLEPAQLALEPGKAGVATLNIRNAGDIVHGYRFEVLGIPADWVNVEPAELTLYPGASGSATVNLTPPRSPLVTAGEQPFAIRVVPVDAVSDAVVPEAVLNVAPFQDVFAELVPKSSQGSGSGRHEVAIDNRGNTPISVQVAATDPAAKLRFSDPELVYVPPGQTAFGRIDVKPEKRLWKGGANTLPFVVEAVPDAGRPIVLDGTRVQTATLPKWLFKALAALIALLALLAALWFLLVKPAVKSQAKDAAAAAEKKADAAQQAAAAAGQKADSAGQKADNAEKVASSAAASPTGGTSAPVKPAPPAAVPVQNQLAVTSAPGAPGTKSFTVPAKSTAQISDIVMQNPQGDFGTAVLQIVPVTGDPRTLLTWGLENIRSDDGHYLEPLQLAAGDKLQLTVTCRQPGKPPALDPAPTTCSDALYYGGTVQKVS